MTRRLRVLAIAGLAMAAAAAAHAQAQAQELTGTWKIVSVQTAPWAAPGDTLGDPDVPVYLNKLVTFGPKSVKGPPLLGCARAVYVGRDDGPDMLFEGNLGGPDRDAATVARGIGMTTPTVRTIETGCSEIAFHRLAPDTLVFGLDNRIYTLRPAPR